MIGTPGAPATEDTGEHLAPVLDATAAVDDQVYSGQIRGEIMTLIMLEVEVPADVLPQPAEDLHAADIVADRVGANGKRGPVESCRSTARCGL